jgi:hypothetical protein
MVLQPPQYFFEKNTEGAVTFSILQSSSVYTSQEKRLK